MNYLLLWHNLAANGLLHRVQPVNVALARREGNLKINYDLLNPGGVRIDYHDTPNCDSNPECFVVQTATFNKVLSMLTDRGEKFAMKLDCEGCEYEIIDEVIALGDRLGTFRGEKHDDYAEFHPKESVDKVAKF